MIPGGRDALKQRDAQSYSFADLCQPRLCGIAVLHRPDTGRSRRAIMGCSSGTRKRAWWYWGDGVGWGGATLKFP